MGFGPRITTNRWIAMLALDEASVASATNEFAPISGWLSGTAATHPTENNVKVPFPRAATLRRAVLRATSASYGLANAGDLTVTVRVNGADSAITFTRPSTDADGTETVDTGSVAIAEDDDVDILVVHNTGFTETIDFSLTLLFELL